MIILSDSYANLLKDRPIVVWIDYLIYGVLVFLFVVLPSVVMPELMYPTQTGKFFFFTYTVMVLTVLYLLKLLLSNEIGIRINLIDILLAILLLYISVNRYFIQDIYGFSLRYYELLGLSVLYVILRSCHPKVYSYLLLAVVISGIIQAVYGNLQLYGYYPSHHSGFKMTGSFFNPGPYAGFLAGVFPIALGMYLFRQEKQGKLENFVFEYIPLLGIITILLVIPASQSRAAWLAVAVSTSLLFMYKYRLYDKLKKILDTSLKKVLAFSMLIVVICSLCTGMYYYKQGSADGRLLIWKVTANMIKDNPLFGFGFDRFKAHYMNYQAEYFIANPDSDEAMVADNVYYAFNTPLQFMAENGILSISFLSIVLLFMLYNYVPSLHDQFVLVGILSVLFFSLFSYSQEI